MMEFCKDGLISAPAAPEPSGDAGDRGGTQAGLSDDLGIRNLLREHFGGLKPFGKLNNFFFSHQVAQKPPSLTFGFKS